MPSRYTSRDSPQAENFNRMEDDLTDDMKDLLRAAHHVAPNGETFILETLPLKGMNEQARKDCAFTLWREPFCYIERRNELAVDAGGGRSPIADPRGTPYALSKLGRPRAKQLATDERKERKARRWAIAKGTWATLMTIALAPLLTDWIKGKFSPPTPPQQTAPATTQSLR